MFLFDFALAGFFCEFSSGDLEGPPYREGRGGRLKKIAEEEGKNWG